MRRKPTGYWGIWENFEKEIQKIIDKIGHFPSHVELKNVNNTLSNIVIRYGGINSVREKMGYTVIRKPNYKNWNVFEKNMEKVIEENNGIFPSQKRLKEMGHGSLARAIDKYHGGFLAVRERVGYDIIKKPNGYYEPWKVFERDMKKAIKENNGEFPTAKRLYEMKYGCLVDAIYSYHSGFLAVREKMGYELSRKPENYWKDWKNVKSELEKAIETNGGKFPTYEYLIKIGLRGLVNGIQKYHQGMNAVKIKMGYELKTKPKGYYEDQEVFERELEKVIKQNNGEFPSQSKLGQMKKSGLLHAIKNRGGFRTVRKKMGYKLNSKLPNYWKDFENVKSGFEKIIEETGKFPTTGELRKRNLSGLISAICNYYGGLNAVREKMGYELERKPNDYWKKWENVERKLKNIIKKSKGHFPSNKELRKMGENTLSAAISKYHGGFLAVRKKMGVGFKKMLDGYYKDWKVFEKDMKKVVRENNGKFPSSKRLEELGYGYLKHHAHKYHRGFSNIREKIGYNEQMRIKLAKKLEEVVERMVG